MKNEEISRERDLKAVLESTYVLLFTYISLKMFNDQLVVIWKALRSNVDRLNVDRLNIDFYNIKRLEIDRHRMSKFGLVRLG
jgi:hypothetical protein